MIIARNQLLDILKPLAGLSRLWLALARAGEEETPGLNFVAFNDADKAGFKTPEMVCGSVKLPDCGPSSTLAEPVTLDCERLVKIIKSLPDGSRLVLARDGRCLDIALADSRGEGSDFKIDLVLEDDSDVESRRQAFPAANLAGPRHVGYAGILAEALQRLKPAVANANSDARYMLAGVHCQIESDGSLRLEATDGHCAGRLCLVPLADREAGGDAAAPAAGPLSAILPIDPLLKALKAFAASEPVALELSSNSCLLTGKIYRIMLPRRQGVFVDFQRLWPQGHSHRLRLEKRRLEMALAQALAAARSREMVTRVTLEIDGDLDRLEISAQGEAGRYFGVVPIDFLGGAGLVEVAFNADLFLTMLKSLDADEIEIAGRDGNSPWCMRGFAVDGEANGKPELLLMPLLTPSKPKSPEPESLPTEQPEAANGD